MRDVVLRALDTARMRGASYADVRLVRFEAESVTVRNRNVEGLVDRVLSISFIATLPEDERATVRDQVRATVDHTPITLPYLTDVFLFRRR